MSALNTGCVNKEDKLLKRAALHQFFEKFNNTLGVGKVTGTVYRKVNMLCLMI